MFDISPKLLQPHTEVNEDGIGTEHPGYMVRWCSICKEPILIAKIFSNKDRNECGRDSHNTSTSSV